MTKQPKEQKFTPEQISHWRDYEEVRTEGKYNMYDPRARQLTGMTGEEYTFVMKHYAALKELAANDK